MGKKAVLKAARTLAGTGGKVRLARGIDLEEIYTKRRSIGPKNNKTRELFMAIGTSMGKYYATMERIFRHFKRRVTPSLQWTESRILQVEGETRRIQHCQVLVQKFHAQRLLSASLVDMVLLKKNLPVDDRDQLDLMARRFIFEPFLRDELACFVYMVKTIREAEILCKRGSPAPWVEIEHFKIGLPIVQNRLLRARNFAMQAVSLQAELVFDRIYRHMDNRVREITKKIRGLLNGRLKEPASPEVRREVTELVKKTEAAFRNFLQERAAGSEPDLSPRLKKPKKLRNKKIHYYVH
ncbi:hypothetical protein F5X96DRAFT_627577 [Biscogniauxia mediterranea]|nr:hypothetical protein F5X96DRAFT_627577 [Biscogniauxia mediterranea]